MGEQVDRRMIGDADGCAGKVARAGSPSSALGGSHSLTRASHASARGFTRLSFLLCSFTRVVTRSRTHSFTHPLTRSLSHSLTRPLTHSLTRTSTHSLTHPSTHSVSQSVTYPPTHSFTHTPVDTFTHSLGHIPTHSFTHSHARRYTHSLTQLTQFHTCAQEDMPAFRHTHTHRQLRESFDDS